MNPEIQKRNKSLFAGTDLDAILIAKHEAYGNDKNFHHVTGIPGDFAYSFVIVYPDGSFKLIVSELEAEEAETYGVDYTVEKKLSDTLQELTKGMKILGLNYSGVTAEFISFLRNKAKLQTDFKDVSKPILESRLQKTSAEMKMIRDACSISSRVARKIPEFIKPHMTELQLAAAIEYEMKTLGSSQPSFRTIVAFGSNSAIPHYNTGARALKEGDFILCDFGATVGYMTSDTTATFVKGIPQQWQRDLYKIVSTIQRACIEQLRVGTESKPIQDFAKESIEKFFKEKGWPGGLIHGLGHSFGLLVHDGHRFGSEGFKIPEEFCTTVEPGGYIPGKGGVRIEDCILVTKKGPENLTNVNLGELTSV